MLAIRAIRVHNPYLVKKLYIYKYRCVYIYIFFLNQIYFSRELIFEFGEFLNVCQTLHFHKRLSQYSLSEFGV